RGIASSPIRPPPPACSTISLHDALPISLVRRDLHHRRAPEQRIERALRAQMTTPAARRDQQIVKEDAADDARGQAEAEDQPAVEDRKSTRLNSSHVKTSYAVFCLKKKT